MRRLVAVAVLVVLAAACSNEPPTSQDGRRIVTFQVAGEAEEITVYRTLVAAFEMEQDDIEVELIEIADRDDHLQKLTTSFAGGEPPDVWLINFREYSQFVVRGAIDPVGSRLEEAGIDIADYYEAPVEAFTFDDELQCMPQNISSLVVYYNKALFRQAGLPRPPDDWDWDEFREYAIKLTTDEVKGVGIDPGIIRAAPFVWSNGGEIVDDLESPSRFTLEEPAARDALEYVVGLVREDGVVPTEQELAAQDIPTRFVTGKLGMFLSSRRETPVLRERFDLEWDVAPLPSSQQPAGILHSDAYCNSAGGPNPEDALRFIAYATGREGQTITALGGRTVPSLREVSTSGAFLDPVQPPRHSEVFLDAIPSLRRTPVIPTWPEIEDIADEIFTRAFYEDDYSIDDALRELEAATAELFEEGTEF
jgi:multiple sugar transport system substrate-binding protein